MLCAVRGCYKRVERPQFLCHAHWYSVPPDIRNWVWDEYWADRGSPAHLAAVRDAIRAADPIEGADLPIGTES